MHEDAPPPALKTGDKVSYTTVTTTSGGGMKFSSREGTLVELGKTASRVKAKNGRTLIVDTESLRSTGQQNALTENLLKAFKD